MSGHRPFHLRREPDGADNGGGGPYESQTSTAWSRPYARVTGSRAVARSSERWKSILGTRGKRR